MSARIFGRSASKIMDSSDARPCRARPGAKLACFHAAVLFGMNEKIIVKISRISNYFSTFVKLAATAVKRKSKLLNLCARTM